MVRSTILIEYDFVECRANAVFVNFPAIVMALLLEYLCCFNIATGTSSIENIEELNKFPEPRNHEAK